MLPKIRIISKNVSKKICWTLNSVQQSQCVHMSTSPQSGARGSKDRHILKYYITFIIGKVDSLLGWALPKIRIISKNHSNKRCWALNSVQKRQWPSRVELGFSRDCNLWNIIMFKIELDSVAQCRTSQWCHSDPKLNFCNFDCVWVKDKKLTLYFKQAIDDE